MDDDAKRDLCRRLKDKYVDKFGYNKKIVIDDCLTQFIDAHDSTPSAQAMKELDVVMKKRVMGKDVKYQSPAEASLNSKSQYSSQPNLSRNKSFANPSSRQAGGPAPKKKDDKAVQQKLPDVTGKITNLPAPKIKRKQVKTVDEPTLENSQKSVLDEDLLNSIIRGEASDPRNPKKKVNRWGLIDMYKSDQYQAELKNISGKKKEEAEKYKKLLDIQMNQISQIKQMDNIETKAGQLMMRGENYTNKPVDEKALLNEYDSLQKEMEKKMQIHRLQNEYTWATGAGVGRPALSLEEKKEQMTKYKHILDNQLLNKADTKVTDMKEKEFYKDLYKKAGDELNLKSKEKAISKKKDHENYSRLLDEQMALKKKIDEIDMNDAEFKYNKDLITKATSAYQKH